MVLKGIIPNRLGAFWGTSKEIKQGDALNGIKIRSNEPMSATVGFLPQSVCIGRSKFWVKYCNVLGLYTG